MRPLSILISLKRGASGLHTPLSQKPVCLLGIGGGSGSGKSWLAHYLKSALGAEAAIVCSDWYYRHNGGLSLERTQKLNFDHPSAIELPFLLRHIDALMSGEQIQTPRYDYASHSRLRETHAVQPAPLVIVEGLLVLHAPELLQRFSLSVYIDVPDDQRLIRRIRRDVEHRHVDLEETLRLYEHCVRPMHKRFVHPSAANATWIWQQNEDKSFPRDLLTHLRMALRQNRTPGASRPGIGLAAQSRLHKRSPR